MSHARSLRVVHGNGPSADSAAALRAAPFGVIILSANDDQVLLVNDVAIDYLHDLDVATDPAALRSLLGDPREDASPTILRGARKLFSCTVRLDGEQAVYYLSDVTSATHYERLAARSDMEHNQGRMEAMIRHEIANPLNTMHAVLTMLERRYESYSDEQRRDYIGDCRRSVDGLIELFELLRSGDAVDAFTPQPVMVMATLRPLIALLAAGADEHGIELVVHPLDPDCAVNAHPRALRQIVSNVVTNAIDALEGTACPRIELDFSIKDETVAIDCLDNGPGIPENVLANIFTPNFTTKTNGTGLGLPIARQLLRVMEGDIHLQGNNASHGTTVHLTLNKATMSSTTSASQAEQGESGFPCP